MYKSGLGPHTTQAGTATQQLLHARRHLLARFQAPCGIGQVGQRQHLGGWHTGLNGQRFRKHHGPDSVVIGEQQRINVRHSAALLHFQHLAAPGIGQGVAQCQGHGATVTQAAFWQDKHRVTQGQMFGVQGLGCGRLQVAAAVGEFTRFHEAMARQFQQSDRQRLVAGMPGCADIYLARCHCGVRSHGRSR